MIRFALIGALLAAGLAASPAWSLSKAANYLLAEQVKKGCGDVDGRFDPKGVEERDLTGDGKPDLIIDHNALLCDGGGNSGRSLECTHPAACTMLFYVREGLLLKLVQDAFGVGAIVRAGSPPKIELTSPQFDIYSIRWDGRSFANVPAAP